MLPQVEFDPRYLPIVNLSNETIPAFAIMKISGMDANQSLQVIKPNRDDENSGFLANEDSPIATNTAGRGRVMQPFILDTNGEGSPPAVGEIWGVENGSWFLSRDRIGYKILALGQNSTRVLVERMDSQYITDLRVTSASNATGPNLSNYYPVIERKFDSVNQTWSENGTGYLQLSNAPTVNATYTGYRDGCNLLPTYRAIQGSTTTANATGSNVDRVRLVAQLNNTTWNATLLLPDPANTTTMNGTVVNVTFPGTIASCMGLAAGQEIVVQNTTVSNQTIRLPQWVSAASTGNSTGNVDRVRLIASVNSSVWNGTLIIPDPVNATVTDGPTVNVTFLPSGLASNLGLFAGMEIAVQNTTVGNQTIRLPQWTFPLANSSMRGIVDIANQTFAGIKRLIGVVPGGGSIEALGEMHLILGNATNNDTVGLQGIANGNASWLSARAGTSRYQLGTIGGGSTETTFIIRSSLANGNSGFAVQFNGNDVFGAVDDVVINGTTLQFRGGLFIGSF